MIEAISPGKIAIIRSSIHMAQSISSQITEQGALRPGGARRRPHRAAAVGHGVRPADAAFMPWPSFARMPGSRRGLVPSLNLG